MAKKTLKELLFGTQTITPYQTEENQELNNYLNTLGQQPYMQGLLNQPQETGLSLDQYKQGFKQGLNFGVPELAEKQKEFNINIPKTPEEIELAQIGEFNKDSSGLKGGLIAGPVEGGFFNDLASGYKENYNNGFNFDNLKPQNKGFATRLGEGLGTVGRFIDSPFGRGLIAAGLDSALGYDNALQEGLTAMVGRQNNMTEDNIYRQSLIDDYGFDPEEIGNIRGNISRDLYNTIAANRYKQASLKVRQDIAGASDNTKRANMIMTALNNGMITPDEAQMQMAKYGVTLNDIEQSNNTKLLPYKQYAMQVAPQVALGNLGVAQGNLALNQARLQEMIEQNDFNNSIKWLEANKGRELTAGAAENLSGTFQGINQMKNLKEVINKLPNRITTPGVAQVSALNPLDTDAQAFNQYVKTYKQVIGKGLEGGVLRKEDEYKYDQIIPKMGDTKAVLKRKADQLQAMLENKYNTDLNFYNKAGFNTSGFNNIPQASGTQTIGKYKVRVK